MLALLALLACASTPPEPTLEPPPAAEVEAPPAGPALTAADLARAQVDLGLDLLAQLSVEDRGNLALSPASLGHALTMTWAGARGDTAAQLARLLGLRGPDAEVDAAAAALRGGLSRSGDAVTLQAASRLFAQRGGPLEDAFVARSGGPYGAPLSSVDFLADAEAARGEINRWISEQTLGHVPELLPAGSVDAQSRLVLADAIFFLGQWATPFDPALTEPGAFTLAGGEAIEVPMMHRAGRMEHARISGVDVLRLPYADGALSMTILLPEDPAALASLEPKLDADTLTALTGAARARQVDLRLPRFSLRSASSLAGALASLGAADAFSARADFSGITGDTSLYLTAAVHEVQVQVDEAGTVAAGATGVVAGVKSAPEAPTTLTLDRPFLFFISDRDSGQLLFLGRVADPRG